MSFFLLKLNKGNMESRRTSASFVFNLDVTQWRSADAKEGQWYANDHQLRKLQPRLGAMRVERVIKGVCERWEEQAGCVAVAVTPACDMMPGRSAVQQE